MPLLSPDGAQCFVHLPKMAGTYVHAALPTWVRYGGHDPARTLSFQRWFFGTIRRPADWYLSVFLHARRENPAWSPLTASVGIPHLLSPAAMPQELWPPIGAFDRFPHRPAGPLWTESLRLWFCDENGTAIVQRVIDTEHLIPGIQQVTGTPYEIHGRVNTRAPWQEHEHLSVPLVERIAAHDGELGRRIFEPGTPVLILPHLH